jgi:hypothetical protein
MRILVMRVLLFFTPFAVYFAFLLLSRRLPQKDRAPWTMLVITGLALVVASFVWLGLTEGETTSGRYVPPHMEAGRIVPGHVEQKP